MRVGLAQVQGLGHHAGHDPLPPTTMRPEHSLPERVASRRRFIRLLGGGSVLAATAQLAGCGSTLPDTATAAWRTAADQHDLRRFMLAHGLLAPNPHNRQPWIADLREPDRIHLICDGDRLLPQTDPFGRQILIGCGAFIELAVLAAAERGVAVSVQAFPGGAPAAQTLPGGCRVATLVLGAPGSARADPLFAQITRRHSAKTAYAEGRPLPDNLVQRWMETARAHGLQAGVVSAPAQVQALRRLTRQGYEIECGLDRTWLESAHLMRIGPSEINRHRDGIALNSGPVRALHLLGVFDPLQVPQRGGSDWQRVMDRWMPFETGSGFLWLASPDRERPSQLAAGRAHVRQHLQATAAGVDLHPLSQVLQEFAEMHEPHTAVHRQLGVAMEHGAVQMLSRVGQALQAAAATPRRELGTLLRT